MTALKVPYFRPDVGQDEIQEVVAVLRSGWLTTGPRVRRFEEEFAAAVGARHAIAVSSCTAALHVAVEALGLRSGQAVLVPALTFAATAAVVRYLDAVPVFVDCDPVTGNLDLADAERKLQQLRTGGLPAAIPPDLEPVGLIPVHVGGLMMDMDRVGEFCGRHGLWAVEDAAHAFPASWRRGPDHPWQRAGEQTAAVSCFSFYANKCITTGEGGMAVTGDDRLAARMRSMSLHGLSRDAWGRYSAGGSWDYEVAAPGYKYNLTDMAAAIGIHQLARAAEMRCQRERVAHRYAEAFAGVEELETPPLDGNRIPSWHLFPIRLRTERLALSRNDFIRELNQAGVGASVHWRPLHLQPCYRDRFGWRPEDCPVAAAQWERFVSLPIFSAMREEETQHVIDSVKTLCARHARLAPA
jgi:perosamine synthetase